MSTPSRQASGAPLQNLVPSGSFLQQLLEEINGSDTPTVLRDRDTPQGSPQSQPVSTRSRRSSSVWVGGTSIAQDARKKLRAADEARLGKTSVSGTDGTTAVARPILHLRTPRFDAPVSCLGRSSTRSSPTDPSLSHTVRGENTAQEACSTISYDVGSAQPRPTVGGLRLPESMTYSMQPSSGLNDIARLNSPRFFCDIDSDLSTTPSPTEPPTSAISATLTDATTVSDSTTVSDGRHTSRSPGKRALSRTASPELLSKKMRTMTLPANRGRPMDSSWRRSIGGDNRCVIHSSTFTERTPTPLESMNSATASTFPELSSFRPQVADPQGVPPMSSTPVRPSTRRSSMIERDESPPRSETPTYARSLHLIDTEISIYKKVHGDEWTEYPLCLHCFRQHGAFNRINEHGYELCGRDEALESHYWESNGDTDDE